MKTDDEVFPGMLQVIISNGMVHSSQKILHTSNVVNKCVENLHASYINMCFWN